MKKKSIEGKLLRNPYWNFPSKPFFLLACMLRNWKWGKKKSNMIGDKIEWRRKAEAENCCRSFHVNREQRKIPRLLPADWFSADSFEVSLWLSTTIPPNSLALCDFNAGYWLIVMSKSRRRCHKRSKILLLPPLTCQNAPAGEGSTMPDNSKSKITQIDKINLRRERSLKRTTELSE